MEADAPELSLGRSLEQGILRPGPVPVRSLFVIQEPGIPGTDRIYREAIGTAGDWQSGSVLGKHSSPCRAGTLVTEPPRCPEVAAALGGGLRGSAFAGKERSAFLSPPSPAPRLTKHRALPGGFFPFPSPSWHWALPCASFPSPRTLPCTSFPWPQALPCASFLSPRSSRDILPTALSPSHGPEPFPVHFFPLSRVLPITPSPCQDILIVPNRFQISRALPCASFPLSRTLP